MSIEKLIQENTEALRALTAALTALPPAGARLVAPDMPKAAPAAPQKEAEKPQVGEPPKADPAPEASGAPTFDQVAAVVTQFIKDTNAANATTPNAGKTRALEILKPFVGEGKTLQAAKDDPKKLADILAAFKAA